MNRSTIAALVALALSPAFAFAETTIQARADVPSTIIMDGVVMGTTPMDIARVKRGEHDIRFVAVGTDLEQAFHISVPHHSTSFTPIAVEFGPVAVVRPATVLVEQPVIVERPVVVERPVYVSPRPAVIVVGRPCHRSGHYRW